MKHLCPLVLKTLLVMTASVFCFTANAVDVDANAAKALAKENNCFNCHAIDKVKIGPAWNQVAAKLKGDPKAEEKLIWHLSSGHEITFPDGHKEAHKIVKVDDPSILKNLVDWILSL
jgi:cytochrome c